MDAIFRMLRERNRKTKQMLANWEPSQRVKDYQAASKQTIISTYQSLLKKTLEEIDRKETKIKIKYDRPAYSLQELNAGSVRTAAMDTKSLEEEAQALIGLRVPVHPEKMLLIGRELRSRNKQDIADTIAHHVTSYLDKPWVDDQEWQSLQKLRGRIGVYESQSKDEKGMLVLDLSEHPKREAVIPLDRFDDVEVQDGA
jgi:hypothetical protein